VGQSDSYQNMSIEVSSRGVTMTTPDMVQCLRIGTNPLRQRHMSTQCSGMVSSIGSTLYTHGYIVGHILYRRLHASNECTENILYLCDSVKQKSGNG
jgi:hypothetical protein